MSATEPHDALDAPVFDKPVKILIVVAPYYQDIAEQLVTGAQAAVESVGGTHETVKVPGALEVPTAISLAARSGDYDGFAALGCVIRGETTHYDTVCNDSSRALQLMGLNGICIGNGILTVENRAQAVARAEASGQNKGGGAAMAALHLIALNRKFSRSVRGIGFKPSGENILIAGND